MAKLMAIQGTGAYYSPAIQDLGSLDTMGQKAGFLPGTVTLTSVGFKALEFGGGYLVGREFGVPVLGALGAGIFGMLGLLGAVIYGVYEQKHARPNGRRRGRRAYRRAR